MQLLRDSTAQRPDWVWLTDITEHPTGERRRFVCAVKDVCSRRIVRWAISERMTSEPADTALRTAVARRRPTGTDIEDFDRSGQFRSLCYQRTLRDHGFTASTGRVEAAGDNAATESFFAPFQKKGLSRRT
jgi:putative transposase